VELIIHPLWPELEAHRDAHAGLLKKIRVHFTDVEKTDALKEWLSQARYHADQCREVGHNILNTPVEDWSFKTGKVSATPASVNELHKARLQNLRYYEERLIVPPGPNVRIPPGGILRAHENESGEINEDRHFLKEHTIPIEQLRQRLDRTPYLKAASTVINQDEALANQVTAQVIAANQNVITNWLNDSNRKPKIRLPEYDFGKTVGVILSRCQQRAKFASKVIIVLTYDPQSPVKYWIKTGYFE
jgi:hypothetical protein